VLEARRLTIDQPLSEKILEIVDELFREGLKKTPPSSLGHR